MGQRVGGMIVRLHHGGVDEVTQGDGVAGLESAGIDTADARDFRRHRHEGRERITGGRGPVHDDHGGGDFCQACDLAFFVLVAGGEDVAGVVIDDDVAFGGAG